MLAFTLFFLLVISSLQQMSLPDSKDAKTLKKKKKKKKKKKEHRTEVYTQHDLNVEIEVRPPPPRQCAWQE